MSLPAENSQKETTSKMNSQSETKHVNHDQSQKDMPPYPADDEESGSEEEIEREPISVGARFTKLDDILKAYDLSQLTDIVRLEDDGTDSTETIAKCKILYEGPPKCSCCINWVEQRPYDIDDPIEERADSKRHALLIRMKRRHGGEGKLLVLDSLVVQSDSLKKLLAEVFKNYSGITTSLKKLVFKPPFHNFFHEWDRFNELCDKQKGSEREQAHLLQDVLYSELEETLFTSKDFAKNKVVTFDFLWTLFRPGMDVYSAQSGDECIYRLISSKYVTSWGETSFSLTVQRIDNDGSQFGWSTTGLVIPEFSGTCSYEDLDVIPTSLHSNLDEAKEKITARGRKFREYTKPVYYYAAYKGLATSVDNKPFHVDGRIIVDTSAYQLFNPHFSARVKAIDAPQVNDKFDVSDDSAKHSSFSDSEFDPPPPRGTRNRRAPKKTYTYESDDSIFGLPATRKSKKKSGEDARPDLDDDMLCYCAPTVRGYCLKTKKWGTFTIDLIKSIRWNVDAFDSLVMAKDLKRMILSFVESQVANKDSFDDIIEGKGRGIIMLLEGSPGVGKTLTAEAVADKLQRPLYAISGGEVGHQADFLEHSLGMILEVAAKWDAVLLLDECDVFLEKRSHDNLSRNSTVAVFLRMLEYYRGILFMTTNRINTIDPAFQSRIHLTIEYPDLDFGARRQVWRRFMDTFSPESAMPDEEIEVLAREEVNGREIKNLIKTAQLLAKHEKSVVKLAHIQTVLGVMKRRVSIQMK